MKMLKPSNPNLVPKKRKMKKKNKNLKSLTYSVAIKPKEKIMKRLIKIKKMKTIRAIFQKEEVVQLKRNLSSLQRKARELSTTGVNLGTILRR